MRAMILAAAMIASPVAAADQFDLVCKGQYKERPNSGWKPVEVRYRIDIPAKSWCFESCRSAQQIQSIEGGKLVLFRPDPADRRSGYATHEIDRVSGNYSRTQNRGIGSFWEEEGHCEPADFSGFPSPKF